MSVSEAPLAAKAIAGAPQPAIDLEHDPDFALLWGTMGRIGRPGHNPHLVAELAGLKARLADGFADGAQPFRHFVTRSGATGTFGLGADPRTVATDIRAGALSSIAAQMRAAALAHHAVMSAFGLPIVTIALVEGDALGLGFELALAHDLIVAERSAQFGFPETLLGLFPAAGAASFLTRRVGRATAERLMLSGALHSGEELHRLGVIDVLAEDGCGETAVRDFVDKHAKRFTMQRAVYAARRRVHPLTLAEIEAVCELWAETALGMTLTGLASLDLLAQAERQRLAESRPRAI